MHLKGAFEKGARIGLMKAHYVPVTPRCFDTGNQGNNGRVEKGRGGGKGGRVRNDHAQLPGGQQLTVISGVKSSSQCLFQPLVYVSKAILSRSELAASSPVFNSMHLYLEE